MSKGMHGKNAEDLIVKVPPCTVVMNEETNAVIADLVEHGQRAVIAKAGRGGRGNFALLHLPTRRQNFLKKVSQDKN